MGERSAPLYVGVDVGGTNIAAALVESPGTIVARARNRTPRDGVPKDTLNVIIGTVEDLLDKADVKPPEIAAIGLGVPGIVDPEEGRIIAAPNLRIRGLRVANRVERKFGVPAVLGNDVDVAMMGEQWLGAARGCQSGVGIFVGTGIGGCVISGGKVIRGTTNAAGEIGHIIMQIDGPLCGCGNRGCLEALASRTAIARDIREAVASGRKTVLTDMLDGDLSVIKSKPLRRALKKEDPLVKEIMGRCSEILGYACRTMRHLLDPEVIVLGGGVIEACGDFVMPIVEQVMASDPLPRAKEAGRLVRSELGDDAGVLGAVALAKEYVEASVAPAGDVEYPTITGTAFGEVTLGETVYNTDIYIRADGKARTRNKKPVKKEYGTSHQVGPEELQKVCKGDPEILVIGTGQQGAASLTEPGQDFLRQRGIRCQALPTPKAIQAYNKAKGRKAALIHVTC